MRDEERLLELLGTGVETRFQHALFRRAGDVSVQQLKPLPDQWSLDSA
jgi:hypothetical protein